MIGLFKLLKEDRRHRKIVKKMLLSDVTRLEIYKLLSMAERNIYLHGVYNKFSMDAALSNDTLGIITPTMMATEKFSVTMATEFLHVMMLRGAKNYREDCIFGNQYEGCSAGFVIQYLNAITDNQTYRVDLCIINNKSKNINKTVPYLEYIMKGVATADTMNGVVKETISMCNDIYPKKLKHDVIIRRSVMIWKAIFAARKNAPRA